MSGPLLLSLPFGSGISGFTSTRVGGVSVAPYASLNLGLNTDDDMRAVAANREAAWRVAGVDPARPVQLRQVHGDLIVEARVSDAGRGAVDWAGGLADADAVFTRVRGLPLAIGHADCLAVVLVDTEAGLLGLAHTGWRGALAGLPGKLAGRLVAEGAQAQRLRAFLSPCLGPAHLELGEEQYRAFLAADPKARNYLSRLEKGRFFLDLWTCARCHLEGAGLAGTHIQGQEMDTWSHPELFFSYRRDYGKTGRMLTAAWLD